MIAFYAQIKWIHIASVLLSGSIFLWRGMLVQAGRQTFALGAPLRFLSIAVDTVLLTSALMLVSILPAALFANGWLAAKLILLVVYVGLATFALKRGRSARVRTICFGAALLVYLTIISIAFTHNPLGWLTWLH